MIYEFIRRIHLWPSPWSKRLTAGSAVVTDDWQQVIGGGLGGAVLGQERLHFEAFQREGHMSGDFGGEHKFMSEALEVNAQNLLGRKNFNKAKNNFALSFQQ